MKRVSALAALALLAACSSEEPAPQATASEPAAQASASPGPSPAPAAALTEVPAAFRGYWDFVDGLCAVWSEGQLTIEPQRLTFYESTGEVTAVRQPDPDTIVVAMAMSGEGETWTEESTYRLADGGKVLESNFTQAEGGEPFRRKRCTALVDVPMQ